MAATGTVPRPSDDAAAGQEGDDERRPLLARQVSPVRTLLCEKVRVRRSSLLVLC